MYQTDYDFAPRGWVCPKCGRVYSPNTFMCYYCGENTDTTYSTSTPATGINLEKWWKDYHTYSTTLEKILNNSDTFRVHYEDLPNYNKNGEE